MNKRKFAWAAIFVALIIGIAGVCWNIFGFSEVKMSQAELQQRIDAKMPHTTKNGVTVSDVHLDLTGDVIALSLGAKATKLKTEFDIKAQTRGILTYNNLDGTFHFRPEELKLTDVKTNGESVANRLDRFVDKWVDSKKILDHKDELVHAAAGLVNTTIQAAAEKTLEHVAVYKLPDNLKGNVARMFLQSVEVKDGNVIAHLSFWQFTKMVMFYGFVLIAAIGMTIALMMNPGWGVTFLVASSFGD